jgi:hypothetical protein
MKSVIRLPAGSLAAARAIDPIPDSQAGKDSSIWLLKS